jgi:hypothetical protein
MIVYSLSEQLLRMSRLQPSLQSQNKNLIARGKIQEQFQWLKAQGPQSKKLEDFYAADIHCKKPEPQQE